MTCYKKVCGKLCSCCCSFLFQTRMCALLFAFAFKFAFEFVTIWLRVSDQWGGATTCSAYMFCILLLCNEALSHSLMASGALFKIVEFKWLFQSLLLMMILSCLLLLIVINWW